MSSNRKPHSRLRRLLASTLALGSSAVSAAPYVITDHDLAQSAPHSRNNHVQPGMESMSPMERFLYSQPLVHTFGTAESCSRKCPRTCVVQEVADLMMPRYVCPAKGTTLASELTPISPAMRGDRALNTGDLFPSSQMLLILVPLGIVLALILLLIICRRCAKRNSSFD